MSDGDATLPLQKAIVAALKEATPVSALVGAKVYDNVPKSPEKPYVSIGPVDVLTEVADEYEGSDISFQIDGWSAGPKSVEVKQLGRAIRTALHEQSLELDENQRLVSLIVEQVRYLPEPDGISQHVAVTVRALTEPSA